MQQRRAAEAVMLGMPGFVVLGAHSDEETGELVIEVETDQREAFCRSCGVIAKSKGRRTVVVRDTPAHQLSWS